MDAPTLTFPWQREGFEAWKHGGRTGLVALSPGLPMGDLPYAIIADALDASRSTNILVACAVGEADGIFDTLAERFGMSPTRLIDHHFLEPQDDGTLIVADLEELRTVALTNWGRFASTGLLILLDADGVGQEFGHVLLETPFASRFCLSRQPSATDLLVSRPWAPGFGPLLYRYTEAEARDVGILPRMHYRLHIEMLRKEQDGRGPEGPWEATDIPTRVPAVAASPFARGKARDVAIEVAAAREGLAVIHDGAPIKGASWTGLLTDVPSEYETPPPAWLLADPSAGVRDLLRIATIAFKAHGGPGVVEDTAVLPVPVDLCQVPPWDDRWRSTARQLDRATVALLLADDPGEALGPEDLETLVGVALALRGLPQDTLHGLSTVVADAAAFAHSGKTVPVDRVRKVASSHGGLAAALLVAAEGGPAALLRLAHPGFTPATPDLPHPTLYDARRHAWRGRAFAALAQATSRGDLVTAWGRYPELRFVFPSSLLMEAATAYCKRHRLKGPLDDHDFVPIEDRTKIADGDRDAAYAALKEWSDALGIAEEHEREFLARMHAKQPERERRREGMALPAVKVRRKEKDFAVLDSTQGRFPKTNISPGSEVALVAKGGRDELGRGLVSRISNKSISIEFPDGSPHRLPKLVTVNLTFDAKVFEAYHSAVTGAVRSMQATQPHDNGPDGLLRAALLGEVAGAKKQDQGIDVDNLTPSQKEAIDSVLQGGRVRLIHGPPGTGKTHTLVHLAMALTRAGHSVLVTADSNAAVDNLVVGLRQNGAMAVRVGHAPNIRDERAQVCRVDPLEAPRFVRWAAGQGIVVATTNYGAYRYLDARGSVSPFIFDYVVHDEAGQSTAPSSLAAVMRGRRLVLAGDPLQLPPTVVSMDAKDAGLDQTLFERIEQLTGRDRTRMIKTQFRSRAPIMAFSSERYYEDEIETAPVAAKQDGLPEFPVVAFQHVTGRENPRLRNGSISNDWEVEAVAAVLDEIRPALRENGWNVAVLTPYQAQRERLRRRLDEVEVSTVDGAQGREWDVVLYSAVRSNPKHRLGFLSDERRLNVAVTRARRNFILIGDERTLSDHDGFKQLIGHCKKVRIRYPEPAKTPPGGRGGVRRRGGPKGAGPKGGQGGPAGQGGPGKKRRRRRRGGRGRGGKEGAPSDGEGKTQSSDDAKQGSKRTPRPSAKKSAGGKKPKGDAKQDKGTKDKPGKKGGEGGPDKAD